MGRRPNKYLILISLLYLILPIGMSAKDILIENNLGVKCIIDDEVGGYALGSIYLNGKLIEKPLLKGIMMVKDIEDGKEYWLYATKVKKISEGKAILEGKGSISGANIDFKVTLETPPDVKAVRILYDFRVDRDISGRQVCLMYNTDFENTWKCHMYPWVEDSKFIKRDPMDWMGIPSLFMYRDDRSIGLLWGIDPNSDYLNPTTWTKDFGIYFIDGVMPAQFRVGGQNLQKGLAYHCPMQIVLTEESDPDKMIIDLVENWMQLNQFKVEPLFVRSNDDALNIFIEGRKKTSLWYSGKGYRLEWGAPDVFIYIGEQGLSAYFDYLCYELTNDPVWRQRAFEQMDFILKGQNTNTEDPHYGAIHTEYSLVDYGAGLGFSSVDRGANVGWKPELNAHLARYMLLTWDKVKRHEGIDRKDWYNAAIIATDWVVRQKNNDGGLPQKVFIKPLGRLPRASAEKPLSSASGRALPSIWQIHKLTQDTKYKQFLTELEEYTLHHVQNEFYYTGHHPDLPPGEFEEASIWGVCEYWLNRYEETGDETYLRHAIANVHLAMIWWTPKQLSWVDNPTQFGAAEQTHYLSLCVYCYQNRKVECLKRLYDYTARPLFGEIYDRILQSIYWTQITEGDLMGATYERTSRPWRPYKKEGEKPDYNTKGTVYMSEQSLDCFLQTLEMYRSGREIYYGRGVKNKVYPDGVCYYSRSNQVQQKVNLKVLPSKGSVRVVVESWGADRKSWIVGESSEPSISTSYKVGDLAPGTWVEVFIDDAQEGKYQANTEGVIYFSYTGDLGNTRKFEVR